MNPAEENTDELRRYRLDISEGADADADTIFLWMSGNSPRGAQRWYEGLLKAYERLTWFPYRNEAVTGRPGVRRMLYGKYRVTYRVIEPDTPEEEGIVRVLQVHHGSRFQGNEQDAPEME